MLLFLNSLGGGEVLIILVFALIFFGSKKIPEMAKGLGKGMREMKDAMQGIKSDINESINLDEEKKIVEDIKKDIDDSNNKQP